MKSTSLAQLAAYKQAIDADIAAYAEYLRAVTLQQYGKVVLDTEVEVFLDVLARGGKRIRGALVMAGYKMCGGTNQAMIIQAARAIEMLHAYMLIIDDIQDRSSLRRGKPSAHQMIAAYHRKHKLKGDAAHAGLSIALNAAVAGAHAAQTILANMDADPQLKLNILSITNRTMAITAHGQTLDIMNELVDVPSEEDIERVLEWKTALYTIINPLHVGMVLAGAGCRETDAITPFARSAGKAFQIVDDILGIYGTEKELGKTPGDDIREGKGTLLTLYALQHAEPADRQFLKHCLGNANLTQQEFKECQRIIQQSGALEAVQSKAVNYVTSALQSLDNTKDLWDGEDTAFLRELTLALQHRVA